MNSQFGRIEFHAGGLLSLPSFALETLKMFVSIA